MSAVQERQEIIIVKRGHDDHDDHHGGAWKIAFADFMTAMFCLFLVLWLVNAANEETKQAVASYFNPVKLVDRNRSVKGLYDAKGIQDVEALPAEGGSGETGAAEGGGAANARAAAGSAAFFADPYEALDRIAGAFEAGDAAPGGPMGGARSWLTEKADAPSNTFFDPFAPERWTEMPQEALPDITLSDAGHPPAPPNLGQVGEADAAGDGAGPGSAARDGAPRQVEAAGEEVAEPVVDEPVADEATARARRQAEQLRDALTEALGETFGEGHVLVEQLTVEARPDAILISLTDNLQIPMFEIGSAIPSPPLVVALEKVGGVIADRAGGIRIEGHTDARPFAAGSSDNWQLSGARAQAAYYMLVRGGVPEGRFRAVTGKADRELAVPDDPLSARNRRIDILVELE